MSLAIFTLSCSKTEVVKNENPSSNKVEEKKISVDHSVSRIKEDSHDSTDYVMSTINLSSGKRLKSTLANFKELAVYIGNKSDGYGDTYNGFTRVDNVDLNAGAGGAYIYLYCKPITSGDDSRIAGIRIVTTNIPGAPGMANYNQFSLWNDTGNPLLYNADLNYGAGGKYIYGYYSYCDGMFGYFLDGIGVIAGSSASITPPAGWTKINGDLNAGAGGKYVYLIVKPSLIKVLVFCP